MPYGPKFKVLCEFKATKGVPVRIVTEDESKPGMARGESWNEREQEWKQWLQSTEALMCYESIKAQAERDALKAERDALKVERDQLKAERDALRASTQPS